MGNDETTVGPFQIREPCGADALAMWQAVAATAELDSNSWYCYLMLCTHFAGTCAVASDDSGLAGFVTGFASGQDAGTWFVWQLWVRPDLRGRGVAARLAEHVLGAARSRFCAVQATVDPQNLASMAFLRSLAGRRGAAMRVEPYLGADLFPAAGGPHGREDLVTLELGQC